MEDESMIVTLTVKELKNLIKDVVREELMKEKLNYPQNPPLPFVPIEPYWQTPNPQQPDWRTVYCTDHTVPSKQPIMVDTKTDPLDNFNESSGAFVLRSDFEKAFEKFKAEYHLTEHPFDRSINLTKVEKFNKPEFTENPFNHV